MATIWSLISVHVSHVFLSTKTKLDNGEVLTGHVEMDFQLTPDGDQRISNSYNPRLRHAFSNTKIDLWSNLVKLPRSEHFG